MKAPLHKSEKSRIAALRRLDILDTPAEDDFDDLVSLASNICGMPISLISLVDTNRQWFKAKVGLDIDETPVENAICAYTILGDDILVINDTHLDPRTQDNALCTAEDGLRFYAGVPLTLENGMPIGSFCVLDKKPNSLNAFQQRALKTLARRVMREIELRESIKSQQILHDEMDHRVKNSLSSIAGAVRVYCREAKMTGDADAAFAAIEQHLASVASLHKSIYLSRGKLGVDLKIFLTELRSRLIGSVAGDIEIGGESSDAIIPNTIASAIGLISNEFLTNTLKHGRIGDITPKLDITVEAADGGLVLVCKNNVPENQDVEKTEPGIGARLMKASVAQHGGELTEKKTANGVTLIASLYYAD